MTTSVWSCLVDYPKRREIVFFTFFVGNLILFPSLKEFKSVKIWRSYSQNTTLKHSVPYINRCSSQRSLRFIFSVHHPGLWSNWNTSNWNTYLKYMACNLCFVSIWFLSKCILYLKYIFCCNSLQFESLSSFIRKNGTFALRATIWGRGTIMDMPQFELIGKPCSSFLAIGLIELFQFSPREAAMHASAILEQQGVWVDHL